VRISSLRARTVVEIGVVVKGCVGSGQIRMRVLRAVSRYRECGVRARKHNKGIYLMTSMSFQALCLQKQINSLPTSYLHVASTASIPSNKIRLSSPHRPRLSAGPEVGAGSLLRRLAAEVVAM